MPRYSARLAAILSLFTLVLAACDNDGTGPNPSSNFLSGTYELNDWSYVLYGDTLPMTEDSYIRIDFSEGGAVEGEGLVHLLERRADGGADTVTILGVPAGASWEPQTFRGSHGVRESGPVDILRFTFDVDAGAGTWVENFEWVLADDRASYRFDYLSQIEEIEIVHRRR